MLTNEDKDFLITLIDINKCISENDVGTAASICESINAMDLTEDQVNSVNDAIVYERCQDNNVGYDAYRVLLENISCIKDAEYKLCLLDAITILQERNIDKINSYLNEKAVQCLSVKTDANQLFYAKILISMCFVAGRFDKMEEIRTVIKEVV